MQTEINFCQYSLIIGLPKEAFTEREMHHKLLFPLKKWMIARHNVGFFLWKKEISQKGIGHYHILISPPIDVSEVEKKWQLLHKKNSFTIKEGIKMVESFPVKEDDFVRISNLFS